MIQFYNHFILPSSPLRAKLAVHLIAQASAEDVSTGVNGVLEKGMKTLGLAKDTKGEELVAKLEGNGTTPYVIKDVREFRAMMQVSAGPQAVKDISEFEELDSKL